MIIKYINSKGKTLILNSSELRIKEANFHNYTWRYSYRERKNGIYINEFTKNEAEYPVLLCAFGSLEKRKQLFNEFLETTEYDVARNAPGTLWYGEWFLECFIIQSSTKPNENYYTEREVLIMGPVNEWIRKKTQKFYSKSNIQTISDDSVSDYPKDYSYDYESKVSKGSVNNEGYLDEDFRMTIYGPTINPAVMIGKNLYQVYTEILEGEYLIIDTREFIVAQYDNVGNETIKFNSRHKDYKIYEKIPVGINDVVWPGDFGFDITTYEKRSEPKWILS